MKRTTLLTAFEELPKEFHLEHLIACLRHIDKDETELKSIQPDAELSSDEVIKIIKMYFV